MRYSHPNMAAKIVLTNPNPDLRGRSKEIQIEEIKSPRVKQLIADLKATMVVENGVGIAAPQTGVAERLIVVETKEGAQAFINPRIVRKSFRKIDSEEGCLSVPGIFGIVRRHRSVVVEAHNEEAQPVTIRATHFPSAMFQHEIDHLDGILFIDKVVRFTKHQKL